ncbi:MAG: CAP domain-containing protein [Planctomycetaceae bacterium]|nr:CAP domain-containing protein [Planctomycetaceae bacterium]
MRKLTLFRLALSRLAMFLALAAQPLWADDQADPIETSENPANAEAVSEPQAAEPQGPVQRQIGGLDWHTDYAAAYKAARDDRKMLFILFRDERQPRIAQRFEQEVLAHRDLHGPLSQTVRVVLPVDAPAPQANPDQQPQKLLSHSSFGYMYGRQGIAIIDLTDPRSRLCGQVVSAHPFNREGQYTTSNTRVILALPRATVTQRALIYAVRMHPAAPVSTTAGQCDGFMCSQARQSSQLMSQYGSVGHHDWGTRSGAISAATGRSASEVAAMAGNRELLAAATELVMQWQGSPPHWQIMNTRAAFFGYDMVRGSGGNWWGTGVFAN